ncbi:MAG: hypothetical protein IJR99_09960 [Kiritimatiellae bacterium]|nr:hypothetical protein [Kiritimatiellia bacterium]
MVKSPLTRLEIGLIHPAFRRFVTLTISPFQSAAIEFSPLVFCLTWWARPVTTAMLNALNRPNTLAYQVKDWETT